MSSTLSLVLEHQALLVKWQQELLIQTNEHFQNVQNFKCCVDQVEEYLKHKALYLQKQIRKLWDVRETFHEALKRIELILKIQTPTDLASSYVHRLSTVAIKIQEKQDDLNEQQRQQAEALKVLQMEVESYKARDAKLHCLVSNFNDLSMKLESSMDDMPDNEISQTEIAEIELSPQNIHEKKHQCDSHQINISHPEAPDDKICREEIEEISDDEVPEDEYSQLLQQAHQELEAYCTYRRNRHNEIFQRNYLRFKRCQHESLNHFFNIIEKEFFHLWIQEDRAKLQFQSQHASRSTQTDTKELNLNYNFPTIISRTLNAMPIRNYSMSSSSIDLFSSPCLNNASEVFQESNRKEKPKISQNNTPFISVSHYKPLTKLSGMQNFGSREPLLLSDSDKHYFAEDLKNESGQSKLDNNSDKYGEQPGRLGGDETRKPGITKSDILFGGGDNNSWHLF